MNFIKKTMASRITLRAETAYPVSQMRAIMVEEVLSRLRNCSPERTWEEKGRHLSEFAQSLKASGLTQRGSESLFSRKLCQNIKQN